VDEEIELGEVYIRALGSTDLGVSFLVKVDGVVLFHSGDLNWWYWWDDTKEEIESMEKAFKGEIEKLNGEKVDITFFPVDPRLKHNYYLGGEYFIEQIAPKVFIPMHFGEDYDTTLRFKSKAERPGVNVIEISKRGQRIEL
jgi:L-ascorbate metabolism protein UlaG (beta-lactamase superfamily)